jgi:hypothetical protein
MKLLAATAITLSLFASASAQTNQAGAASASAQDSQAIRITRRGTQAPRQGPAENFTGSVRVDPLFQANAPARDNGVTQEELIETITHLAFYSGWPNAVTAIAVAREVFEKK